MGGGSHQADSTNKTFEALNLINKIFNLIINLIFLNILNCPNSLFQAPSRPRLLLATCAEGDHRASGLWGTERPSR